MVFQAPHSADEEVITATVESSARAARPNEEVYEAEINEAPRGKARNEKYCHECGAVIRARAVICPKCGVEQAEPPAPDLSSTETTRIAAGICGILFGGLGVHKFILGMPGPAMVMLLVSLFGWIPALISCGVLFFFAAAPAVMHIIGIVEGVIYLTKSDAQFRREYVIGKKPWF